VRLNPIDRCADPKRLILACVIAHQEHGLPWQIETILMHLHDALFGIEPLKQWVNSACRRQMNRRVADLQGPEAINQLPESARDELCPKTETQNWHVGRSAFSDQREHQPESRIPGIVAGMHRSPQHNEPAKSGHCFGHPVAVMRKQGDKLGAAFDCALTHEPDRRYRTMLQDQQPHRSIRRLVPTDFVE